MMKASPVIIIGSNRSGTSLITRLLSDLGLFVGRDIHPVTYESSLFQSINKYILGAAGASLDHPAPVDDLLDDSQVRDIVVHFVRFILKTPKVLSYLGIRSYVHFRSLDNLPFPWGWKDPRTTFTLPIWLELFPKAKVIHVVRHGVDVAQSLKVRHDKAVAVIQQRQKRYGSLYYAFWLVKRFPRRQAIINVRAYTIESAFEMWKEYAVRGREHVKRLGDMALEIRFEDLAKDPGAVLQQTASFCGLEVTDALIEKASRTIQKQRAYAFRSRPELMEIASENSNDLMAFGY